MQRNLTIYVDLYHLLGHLLFFGSFLTVGLCQDWEEYTILLRPHTLKNESNEPRFHGSDQPGAGGPT